MCNVVIFPYVKRLNVIKAEMPLRVRMYKRQLAEQFFLFRNDNNVTSIVDVREEQLMTTLGW